MSVFFITSRNKDKSAIAEMNRPEFVHLISAAGESIIGDQTDHPSIEIELKLESTPPKIPSY